jgi:NAD-dependent deacetylase
MIAKNTTEIYQKIIKSHYPVALTGAGISVASTLPTLSRTFQDIPLEKILERSFFENHPDIFYDFYREILRWKHCKPNTAHYTLAKYNVSIVTQNMDGLHQKAGSKNVIEIHGHLRTLRCEKCNRIFSWVLALKESIPICTKCNCILKPDIVLYTEPIHYWDEAVKEFEKADLVLVIGTNLESFPANQLPQIPTMEGVEPIIINERADKLLDF